jgi:hypothetical protein
MRLEESALVVDLPSEKVRAALSEWAWLIGDTRKPHIVSTAGDLFLISPTGQVERLDTGVGQVAVVAESLPQFEESLSSPDVRRDWFLVPVLEQLQSLGRPLAPGQCYGFSILPIFKEGTYGAENRYAIDALEHIRFTGDLHRQIAGLPDGEQVKLSVT